jgi:maltose/moltooligosaccharide transporter
MWMFYVPTVARNVFGATDPSSELYARGAEWGGLSMAFYSITCFAVAFALPKVAAATSRKTTHAIALACGAVGLLSVSLIHSQYMLLFTMVGVGIAWASILSMPFAILAGALPPHRMGVYMGVFNFFIVIPEILAALFFGDIIRGVFGADNPNASLYMVMIGGASMLVAAALVTIVDDRGDRDIPEQAVIDADEHELLTVQGSVQPVPSTGLVDEEPGPRRL